MSGDLTNFSMGELFQTETEGQAAILTTGLLALEREPTNAGELEACMRSAHSLKGAARIVNITAAVSVAHAMEDCFVAAQRGTIVLQQEQIDLLLAGVDLLSRIANTPEAEAARWEGEAKPEVDEFLAKLAASLSGEAPKASARVVEDELVADAAPKAGASTPPAAPTVTSAPVAAPSAAPKESGDRVLRVTAENLNRLLGLAGESLVESRWLTPFSESLLRLKRMHFEMGSSLDLLRESLEGKGLDDRAHSRLMDAQAKVLESRQFLAQRMAELEGFGRRSANLSHRLYEEALACRMRPFADGVQGFPRMVRDVARTLGKEIDFQVVGEVTQVDRDILERLEAPIGHLLRNAVDHGMELPEDRERAGKPRKGTIHLEARHSAGMLWIIVSDDGRGIDPEKLRETVVQRNLSTKETVARMSEAELLEFLFLPGFTTRTSVSEISGRGVGLDVVQTMVKQVRGTIKVTTQPGRGMRFQLQLPLTLSVVRTLLVEIGGEPYAFPLAYLTRTLKLPKERIELLEGRQHFKLGEQHIGLVTAHQVLESGDAAPSGEEVPVIVLSDSHGTHGVIVDRFLGERELVVQPLDPRLGKVKDIAAAALMEDGSPVLILDVDDLMRSVDKLVSGGRLSKVQREGAGGSARQKKRILVVDDSLTVRELERKLLGSRGYEVEVAVDGMDGWNAARTGHFNLIVTDVDMPRMDGIELVTLLKRDPNLKALPVMIVSYKDREEDRRRGLDAGADYYLTKGSFHDETLLNAVVDLIGEPDA